MGNLRIAVFNHLFARRHGGAFVLRIEDTDADRNVPMGLERILEDLTWAGLDWDEGPDCGGEFGPYLQSARESSHRERARLLEEQGLVYPCFCGGVDAEAERTGDREGPGCPGGCRDLPREEGIARRRGGEGAALRFAIPSEQVTVSDAVRGEVAFPAKDVGDFVILRADGRATYNFAVAVDDIDMRITHVIRGAGHLSNTPKQALVFDALGSPRPVFAHLPTVLGPDGSKLSKRSGAPGITLLRTEGYHPAGVVNYLSLLGWSPGDDREVLTREELINSLDLERVGASDTMYDPDKLRWMSAQHIAAMPLDRLTAAVEPHVDASRFPISPEGLPFAIAAVRSRLHTFSEVNDHLELVFAREAVLENARTELKQLDDARSILTAVRSRLEGLEEWSPESTSQAVRAAGETLGLGGAALFHPVRLALTGVRSGPDLGSIFAALGPERARSLLDRALTGHT